MSKSQKNEALDPIDRLHKKPQVLFFAPKWHADFIETSSNLDMKLQLLSLILLALTINIPTNASPFTDALAKLEDSARELHPDWDATPSNKLQLKKAYEVFTYDLTAAATKLDGDSRLSRGSAWAKELVEQHGQNRLPSSVKIVMDDALKRRKTLEELAGKTAVENAEMNLAPVPIVVPPQANTVRLKPRVPRWGDFIPYRVEGGPPDS